MNKHIIYIVIITLLFGAFTLVFDTFPRSTISQLEKRELATLPKFSFDKLFKGTYTTELSAWFSDTEPYRDTLMLLSMNIKDKLRFSFSEEEQITFHSSKDQPGPEEDNANQGRELGEYNNKVTADEKAKIANRGIVVIGSGENVRALMAFGGTEKGGIGYAEAANLYKKTFGDKVNVYCTVIPTSTEYYLPEKAKEFSKPQLPVIKNIFAHLDDSVKKVNVYNALGDHAAEPIYLRTDHHWAPLGAYYAAEEFAKVAGVPFKPLSSYERKAVRGYVGSMYGYSNDIALKRAPEDFVYYVPKDIDYETTYYGYNIDKKYKVTGVRAANKGPFFWKYKDGSGGAYCTYMASDCQIVKVQTGTQNKRRLIILKDSFGNLIPGFLFYSFEEIHVIDHRYFTRNMKDYVRNNKITDILFANNIFKAYDGNIKNQYAGFLTQKDPYAAQISKLGWPQ